MAPVVVAIPMRERPALTGPKNRRGPNPEFEETSQATDRTQDGGSTHSELTELNRKMPPRTALQILKERVRKLVAEAESLRAQLTQSRNLVASLEPQWDKLAVSVNGVREQHRRESDRLTETIAQLDAMRSELEQTRAALAATENERNQIKSAAQDASELHRADYSSLNSRLEAMTSRALAMEGLVADVG